MTEKAIVVAIKPKDVRCSNCFYGHQIVARMGGGNIEDNGAETNWVLLREIPVGQTRNCFSHLQQMLGTAGEKFIYPNENDTCINPRKFKKR